MPSAPSPTIDVSGVVRWTNPAVPPDFWVLELGYNDDGWSGYQAQSVNVAGSITSYDAHTNGWPGNYWVYLSGIDSNQNLLLNHTRSGNVTLNQ